MKSPENMEQKPNKTPETAGQGPSGKSRAELKKEFKRGGKMAFRTADQTSQQNQDVGGQIASVEKMILEAETSQEAQEIFQLLVRENSTIRDKFTRDRFLELMKERNVQRGGADTEASATPPIAPSVEGEVDSTAETTVAAEEEKARSIEAPEEIIAVAAPIEETITPSPIPEKTEGKSKKGKKAARKTKPTNPETNDLATKSAQELIAVEKESIETTTNAGFGLEPDIIKQLEEYERKRQRELTMAEAEERERRKAAEFVDEEKNAGKRGSTTTIKSKRGKSEFIGREKETGPSFRPSKDLLRKFELAQDVMGFADMIWELAKRNPTMYENPENRLAFLKFVNATLLEAELEEQEAREQKDLERRLLLEGQTEQQIANALFTPRPKNSPRPEYPEWYLKQLGKGGVINLKKLLISKDQYDEIVKMLGSSKTEEEILVSFEEYLRNLTKQFMSGELDDKARGVAIDIVASESDEEARQILDKAYLEDESINDETYKKMKKYLRLRSVAKEIIKNPDHRAELNTAFINETISQEEFLALRSFLGAAKSEKNDEAR